MQDNSVEQARQGVIDSLGEKKDVLDYIKDSIVEYLEKEVGAREVQVTRLTDPTEPPSVMRFLVRYVVNGYYQEKLTYSDPFMWIVRHGTLDMVREQYGEKQVEETRGWREDPEGMQRRSQENLDELKKNTGADVVEMSSHSVKLSWNGEDRNGN